MITLLLGLCAGYVAGSRSRAGAGGDAILEVRAPAGAETLLDGHRLDGTSPWRVPVAPGVAHTVHITLEGRIPLDVPVALQPGQTRVLDVEARRLELARP